ncbi:MAG: hypothetical protein A3F70_04170 [Acidobacteria bacterium RIFCSPLOWO2_12_FULL_67_14]|nr:MAG: hypothetical protein A3H29_08590 [Acidobacteria bacterium RIFCSPLOWO2_02_FULL_67_21]OFW35096.1 MAG: hypothetical protein A3F70_04170 [Acidobacteria bacterium RIFCSPLOWO2_12_FULL_67_14]
MKLVTTRVRSAAEIPAAFTKPFQGELAARRSVRRVSSRNGRVLKSDDYLRLFDSLGSLQ